MGIVVNAEFVAGTSIQDACKDIVALAKRCDCMVVASFNGLRLIARADSTPREVRDWYDRLCADERRSKV